MCVFIIHRSLQSWKNAQSPACDVFLALNVTAQVMPTVTLLVSTAELLAFSYIFNH
jgi:hypothetical protein